MGGQDRPANTARFRYSRYSRPIERAAAAIGKFRLYDCSSVTFLSIRPRTRLGGFHGLRAKLHPNPVFNTLDPSTLPVDYFQSAASIAL